MQIQVRSFNNTDLKALVSLLNQANEGSYDFIPFAEAEVLSRIEERKLKTLIAEQDAEIIGSVTYSDGPWGEEIRWLAVCDRPDRKMIEDLLISHIEKYVKRGAVFTSVDCESPEIVNWVERGYVQDGGLYHMIARLEAPRLIPQVPRGVVLRSLRSGEEDKLVKMVNHVFGFERLKTSFVESAKSELPSFDREWVHLVELEEKIVSVVVSWPATKYNEFYGARRGYLGPAATVPEHRSKNLASALTVRALNFLFEKGMDAATLYTSERNVASVTLLRNLGFDFAHNWKFLRKDFPKEADQTKR